MRDYLEELLEELVEETEGWELPQSASLPAPSRRELEERRGQKTVGEIPQSALLPAPLIRGPRVAEDEEAGKLPQSRLGEPRQLPRGGSLRDRETRGMVMSPPYKSVESLRKRLRSVAMAAAYRANTPAALEIPERGCVREKPLLELDAAVRRDARRYDGEMTLY